MKNNENKIVNSGAQKNIQKGLIVSIISILLFIGLLAGISFAVFTDGSIVGSWQIDSDKEEHRVLTFNSDNTVSLVMDSLQIDGKYEIKGNNKIYIDIEINSQGIMKGDYTYIINSSLIGKTLDLKDPTNKTTQYKQYKEEGKKSDPNLKLDEKLLGTWIDKERNSEYEFKNDGVLTLKNENLTVNFKYRTNEGKISLLQDDGGRNAQTIDPEYKIDGDNLTLGGLHLVRK